MALILKNFTNKSREELIFGLISIIAGLIALTTYTWVILNRPPGNIYGEEFVLDQIPVLPTPTEVFYMKPITIIMISVFIFWIFGLETLRSNLSKLHPLLKRLIFFLFMTIAFIYIYETLWQFLAWNSAYILTQGNVHIDVLYHQPNQTNPKAPKPHNFVFTTKKNHLLVACSLYSMFFFYKLINIDTHKTPEEQILGLKKCQF